VIQKALELEFHEEEAERQLDTAIDWGRYAELLAYDDSSQVLFLEPGGGTEFVKKEVNLAG
jgi:NitT/TauT family transport system ATP-binding protein